MPRKPRSSRAAKRPGNGSVDVEEIKRSLTEQSTPQTPIPPENFLSSGSTLLNLAVTGMPNCCFAKGHYYWLVGDSESGKSFLTLTLLAEASLNRNFDKYRLIYDDVEGGALMDMKRFFGKAMANRIEPPGKYGHSTTLEEFYYHIDDARQKKKPFIYVLDSMDALYSEDEENTFKEHKEAYLTDKKPKGSYGVSKAKLNSSHIRMARNWIRDSGSILFVISQTRHNIGFGSQFNPKTASGGDALMFYAALQLWTSKRGEIISDGNIAGKKRQLGITCRVQIKKNRVNGRHRMVEFPIYHSSGIADVDGMVDYLVEEKHWEEKKGVIAAPEFDFEGDREKLIQKIDGEGFYRELQATATGVWNDIERLSAVKRNNRYSSDDNTKEEGDVS